MENRWFKNTVIYCVDVNTFRDGNGDGIGDFIGLRQGFAEANVAPDQILNYFGEQGRG